MESLRAVFGNPEAWDSAFESNEITLRVIEELRALATDLVVATNGSSNELVQVQNSLTQLCSHSMFDVILLVGNGRGAGAMKIARGMFEISVIATYLEKNPAEIRNYVDFAFVEAWNSVQIVEKHFPGRTPPEVMREAEAAFNRVKAQFSNARGQGRVRHRWTDKSIKQMAEEVDRLNIYEMAYGPASQLHHMPLTGIIAHELEWSKEALFIAHGSLMDTVLSLFNIHQGTDFRERLKMAIANFHHMRKTP